MTRQIVGDWVARFNAEGASLIARKQLGTPLRLNDEHRVAIARAVDERPTSRRDGVVRWRLIYLVRWMYETLGVSISENNLGHWLRKTGYRRLTARPRHPSHDLEDESAFKGLSGISCVGERVII